MDHHQCMFEMQSGELKWTTTYIASNVQWTTTIYIYIYRNTYHISILSGQPPSSISDVMTRAMIFSRSAELCASPFHSKNRSLILAATHSQRHSSCSSLFPCAFGSRKIIRSRTGGPWLRETPWRPRRQSCEPLFIWHLRCHLRCIHLTLSSASSRWRQNKLSSRSRKSAGCYGNTWSTCIQWHRISCLLAKRVHGS